MRHTIDLAKYLRCCLSVCRVPWHVLYFGVLYCTNALLGLERLPPPPYPGLGPGLGPSSLVPEASFETVLRISSLLFSAGQTSMALLCALSYRERRASVLIMALQPRSHREHHQAPQHDGTNKTDLGSGEREEWLVPSAEHTPRSKRPRPQSRRRQRPDIHPPTTAHETLKLTLLNCHPSPKPALCS